jgi:hypothetical protein
LKLKTGEARCVRLTPGEVVMVELPHSEVCMYMRIAGAVHEVELIRESRSGLAMAQILDRDRRPFGGAVTPGEAGIYSDSRGFYAYEVVEKTKEVGCSRARGGGAEPAP